jgi:hypothetical protein
MLYFETKKILLYSSKKLLIGRLSLDVVGSNTTDPLVYRFLSITMQSGNPLK